MRPLRLWLANVSLASNPPTKEPRQQMRKKGRDESPEVIDDPLTSSSENYR